MLRWRATDISSSDTSDGFYLEGIKLSTNIYSSFRKYISLWKKVNSFVVQG